MDIQLLYGSETGTAEFLCEDMQEALQGEVDNVTTTGLDAISPGELKAEPLYVVVSSTYGSGDVPSNAMDFLEALERDKPDLSHVRFAVFGLGDRTFDTTFNQGSEQIMKALIACRATMLGERGIFDNSAGDMPDDIAVPWLKGIVDTLKATQS